MDVDFSRYARGPSTLAVLRLAPLVLVLAYLANRPTPVWPWVVGLLASLLPFVGRNRPLMWIVLLNIVLGVFRAFGIDSELLSLLAVAVWLVDVATKERGRRLVFCVLAAMVTMVLGVSYGQWEIEEPRFWLAIVFYLASSLGIPVLVGLNLRSARLAAQRAEDRAAETERRRESETRWARAEERATIARELHDLMAHHVASIVLRVGVARHVADRGDVTDVLDDVHATGTAVLGDLKRLVAVLRDPSTADALAYPADLTASLEDTITRSRQAGLAVTSSLDPVVADLDAVRGLTVLRVVQEGLTNVLKHAGPGAAAAVRVVAERDDVLAEVTDDGDGRRQPLTGFGGHGLLGLRERVDLVGGTLHAGPLETGWRVAAVLPAVDRVEAVR